jgi:hypothetical protein
MMQGPADLFELVLIESLSRRFHSMSRWERFAAGCLSPILGCDGPGIWPRSPSVSRAVPASTHRLIRFRHRSGRASLLSSRTRRNLSHEFVSGVVKRLRSPTATFWCVRINRLSLMCMHPVRRADNRTAQARHHHHRRRPARQHAIDVRRSRSPGETRLRCRAQPHRPVSSQFLQLYS